MRTPIAFLEKYWGYSFFRENQEKIINCILNGENCLAILPTGAGKSICFQIPALLSSGLTIVISPLIALMEDQVANLKQKNIPADFINSTLLKNDYKNIIRNIKYNNCKLLYIAPEQLNSDNLISILKQIHISRVVIDEAHCLSEWGHDFRPEYRKIYQNILKIQENIQIVAFTATATQQTQDDLLSVLNMKYPQKFVSSFNRENIFLETKSFLTLFGKFRYLMEILKKANKALIYCSSRSETEEIIIKIKNTLKGIKCSFYHAGLNPEKRTYIQNEFKIGNIKYLSATTAFGMGIDISDIDTVIYWNIPSSIEEYYQGIGRAGRNKNIKAKTYLLNYFPDEKKQKNILFQNIPNKNLIRKIKKVIEEEKSNTIILNKFKISENILNSIKLLILLNITDENIIYKRLIKIQQAKKAKFDYIKKLIKIKSCKREFILKYFGEASLAFCNNCSWCSKVVKKNF